MRIACTSKLPVDGGIETGTITADQRVCSPHSSRIAKITLALFHLRRDTIHTVECDLNDFETVPVEGNVISCPLWHPKSLSEAKNTALDCSQ